jgi:hypothetical protein
MTSQEFEDRLREFALAARLPAFWTHRSLLSEGMYRPRP